MNFANKNWEHTIVQKVEETILKKQNTKQETDNYIDTHLQICDEDLLNWTDFIFTIIDEYKIQEEEIEETINTIYDLKNTYNNTHTEMIYAYDLSFRDMMNFYKAIQKDSLFIQRRAKIRAGIL